MVCREMRVCAVSATIASASNASVQLDRPAGGVEQAVAINNASSVAANFRAPSGRGSSASAAARPSSTNRRLVRYTVDVPTCTVHAIVAVSEGLGSLGTTRGGV